MGKNSRLKKIKRVGEESVFSQQKKSKEISLKQHVPRKFTEMMELKELCKNGSGRSIRKKLNNQYSGGDVKQKEDAKRKPHESYYRHMQRLESVVDASLKQARTSVQEFPEKKLKQGNKKDNEKISKKQRLQKMKDRQKKVKELRKEKLEEKDRWIDHVEFGDVVTEPPKFSAKPRKAAEIKKPGQKDFLFLKTNSAFSTKSPNSLAKTKILMDERQRVIDAYRSMKKKKNASKE